MRSGLLCLAFLIGGAGCAKDQDYLDVMKDQQDAWREMTDILKTVKDEKSMRDARPLLEQTEEKSAVISQRGQALPKPPPKKVQERMNEDSFMMNRTLEHLKAEVKRVSDLPGGPEFLKRYRSTKGLLNAVQP